MNSKPPAPVALLAFTGFYFAASVLAAILRGNSEFIIYIAVMAVLIGAVYVLHRRANLSIALLWCLSVWGLLHMAGGLVPIPESWPFNPPNAVLYSLWLIPEKLKYDQIVHAYGFGITTWLCWEALRNGVVANHQIALRPTVGVMVLCAAGGMGFGAFNEVIEFIATLSLPETNVGGYLNTGWDLVYNTIGSALAAIIIYRVAGPRTPA